MEAMERQKHLVSEFQGFSEWDDRYKHIIAKGKALEPMPDELKTEDLKVQGCQSQVWIKASFENGLVSFQADSDALIVKGLIALLLQVYNKLPPDEIIATSPEFIKDLGFASNLSPSRANGLNSMIKQIKYYAVAFKAVSKS